MAARLAKGGPGGFFSCTSLGDKKSGGNFCCEGQEPVQISSFDFQAYISYIQFQGHGMDSFEWDEAKRAEGTDQ